MDHSKKSTYLISLDVLRVLSIFAVILIHQTTTTLQVLNHNIETLNFALFLNQTARFAVPMLFLISGFVLELNNKSNFSYTIYLKKRASRILLPYVLWSIVYFTIWQGLHLEKLFSIEFLTRLFNGTSAYHLYFVPTLIIFYLLFPFLHKFIEVIKNPFFMLSIFLIQLIISFYNYYFQTIPLQEDLRVALLTFSLFIIGIGSAHHKDAILKAAQKYIKFLIPLVFLFIIGIFTHVQQISTLQNTTRYIYNQYGPLNYFYTLILALVIAYLFAKRTVFKRSIIYLSKISFFIFFIHVIILQFLWQNILINLDNSIYSSFAFDILVLILTSLICILIASVVHKIPYASKITG